MSSLQILMVLGALWVWLGFNLSKLRDRHFPGLGDWVLLVFWFMLGIVPIAIMALNMSHF